MKQFIIILALCLALSPAAFAGSIEYDRMRESIKQEQEEQQKQREQQALQPVYNIIVPAGYFAYPEGGIFPPDCKPHPIPHPGVKPNPKPCPIGK
jgi:hypothetical protein